MTSYLIIVNPKSGNGGAARKARVLRDRLGEPCDVRVVETTHRGSATELAASVASGVDRVVAVGGDGTLNEVLTGLMSLGEPSARLPALGFLPAGTANAAIKAFGFTSSPEELARILPRVPVLPVDIGMVRFGDVERPFLLWCGAGYDAVVIDELNTSRTGHMGIGGLLRNAPRVLRAIARYPMPAIQADIDGIRVGDSGSIILANVAEVAFGGTIVDTADPFDGRLDVVAIDVASRLQLVGLGIRMLSSGLAAARGTRHQLATSVRLSAAGDVPVQLDGEPVGTLPISVRLQPGAVRLLLTAATNATT
jgi:diacylglycerol kinase (ATP)